MNHRIRNLRFISRTGLFLSSVAIGLAAFGVLAWQAAAGGRATGLKATSQQTAENAKDIREKTVKSALLNDDEFAIQLNAGPIDTRTAPNKAAMAGRENYAGSEMRLVRFRGPIQPDWYDSLAKAGVQIVDYIPNYTYLVFGSAASMNRVQTMAAKMDSPVSWYGDYTPEMKINPDVTGVQEKLSADSIQYYQIQLFKNDESNAETLSLIQGIQTAKEKVRSEYLHYVAATVALTPDGVEKLSERPDVISIYPYFEPTKQDERQDLIMAGELSGTGPTVENYLTYLAGKGFNTGTVSSFSVNLTDSGVDNGTQIPNHFGLYRLGDSSAPANSRIIYNRLQGTPNAGSTIQGCDGHGNENCHIIGGYVPTGTVNGVNFGAAPHADASGFRWGLGIAPFVKVGSSVIFDPNTFTSPIYQNLESQAYRDSARISSNSWGSSSNAYTTDSQQYDALVRDAQPDLACVAPNCISTLGNQEYIIAFAAGNNGAGGNTVGSPSTAKNVITVGASENVNPFLGADGCGIGDTGADNANDIISFSSRGPTSDGRRKPDIVGPGTHVSGGVAQASIVSPAGSGTGSQLACFNGGGVCGGVGSNFFPAGQQYYTASSGTSHSTPAIAGEAALIRQKFINDGLTPPSPAFTKALIMNAARYMNGVGANDTLPSNSQGMGEMNLNTVFDTIASPHAFHDQTAGDLFTASGQIRTITGNISSAAKPVRITLAWTDAPGATTGNAFVNNLDLEVTAGGNTYKGNVFSGANSTTGGAADTRNNVESVFIPAGVTGPMVIKVTATNIAGNGVPNNATPLDQDFALVASNITEAALPVIATAGSAITAESCLPANSAIDPGENVTMSFSLQNVGTANTTNLTATLLPTGGVTAPSAPQNYGAVPAGGASVSRSFSFTDATTCGQPITIALHLQDGATDLGNVTYTYGTGALGAAATNTYSSGNIAVALPDNTTVDVPVNVPDGDVVSDINVKVRMNHTFDGDVSISLVSPAGTVIPLATNRGGSGDNFGTGANDCSGTPTIFDDAAGTAITAGVAPFAGSFRPETLLSTLNGEGTTGGWKVRFNDNAAGDTGTIGCVQLEVTRMRYICCGVAGTPLPVAGGPAVVTQESFLPHNSVPDPGERLTVNLPVLNNGTGATSNLVGTLLATGGVTNPTGPQTYGAIAAAAPAVSKPFLFTAQGTCGGTVTLTMHLQDGATDYGNVTYTLPLGTMVTTTTTTFSNTTPLVIPDSGASAPYGTTINVSGVPSTVTSARVTLNGLTHTFPGDLDVLLVSPTGRKFIVMSDVIGTSDWVAPGVNYTFDDSAAALLPASGNSPGSGSFKPTDYTSGDTFAAPAPAGPYLDPATVGSDTLTTAFGGAAGGNPNGVWTLYVMDDAAGDSGAMSGWSIQFTQTGPVCSTTLATGVDVSGNVQTADGRGVTNATVTISDSTGMVRRAITGRNGAFTFTDVEAGHTYVVGVMSRRYSFTPQVIEVNDNISGLLFTSSR